MLTPVYPSFHRRPAPAKPSRKAPAPPPGPPLHIIEVRTDDPPEVGICYWVFDGPATLTTDSPANLRVRVEDAWLQVERAWQEDEATIKAQYEMTDVLDGYEYSIDEQPNGIAQSASVVLPQEGLIHAP